MNDLILSILRDYTEEQERRLSEDFDDFETMKEESEEYNTLNDINEVRKFLEMPILTYDDFKDDYKN